MDAMKFLLPIAASGFVAMLLSSCGTSGNGSTAGNHPSGTGPFDSRGNYVEAWADSPSKWKRGGSSSSPGDSLDLASNDEPPPDSIPLPSASNTRQVQELPAPTIVSLPKQTSRSTTVKSTSSSSATAKKRPTSSSSSSSAKTTKPKPKTATASTSKTKPKAKTASRYTIKKGDTLSAIAARNGTSVAALQRANGIKGAMIQPGKALVIPK